VNLIINEIRNGNRNVFKTFFDKNYTIFVTYANGYLYDKAASEDIIQEIFIYVWEHANKIQIKSSLNGYMYAMIRNRCLNYLKTIKITDRTNFLEFNINLMTEHRFDSTSKADKTIVYHQILNIVETLPERMQQIVKLKFLHNYKYLEIAKEMNISVNTVKTQLKRAKSRITALITSILVLLQIHQ
jgi:RNA polymerase sigma-70 factor (ECF subfamily)